MDLSKYLSPNELVGLKLRVDDGAGNKVTLNDYSLINADTLNKKLTLYFPRDMSEKSSFIVYIEAFRGYLALSSPMKAHLTNAYEMQRTEGTLRLTLRNCVL